MGKIRLSFSNGRARILVPLLLVLLGCLFLLPLIGGWLGSFFDDYYEVFPRLHFNARSVRNGSLPLWDPHVFAGGRINYIPNTRIWYWPLYPFYFLADPADLTSSYAWLIRYPLAIQWMICLLTAYGLGRGGLGLRPPASALLSLVYAFGAVLPGNAGDPQTMYTFMWLPLILWGTVSYARNGSRIMAVLAALALAFTATCGSDVRSLFSIATVFLALALLAIFFAVCRKQAFSGRLIKSALLVLFLGLLLSAPYWLALGETVSVYRGSRLLKISHAATASSSTPPAYLLTLLVPDLFGKLTNSRLVELGLPEITPFWHVEGNLTGGYWLFLLCLTGSIVFWKSVRENGKPRSPVSLRIWWMTGLALFAFSILLVTGMYSPVYRWLFRLVPVFGLPYAVRWRVMEHLGITLVAGVSAQALWENRRSLPRWILIFLPLAALCGALSQLIRTGNHGRAALAYAWNHHRAWLVSGPAAYLIAALAVTAGLIICYRRRRAGRVVVILAALEAVLIGFSLTYFLVYGAADIGDTRYRSPQETRLFRWSDHEALRNDPPPLTGRERTTFYDSMIDQMAVLHGGDYLMGMCSKPLVDRLREALMKVTEGYPYELIVERPASRFWANMSVRHLVLEEKISIPLFQGEVSAVYPRVGLSALYDYKLKKTMPRVFTQDRVVTCSPEEALHQSLNGDLREGVFIEDSEQLAVSGMQLSTSDYDSFTEKERKKAADHFNRLQELNEIYRVDFSNPTRVEIDVEMKSPAILVTTDVFHPAWRVEVDGRPANDLRVNYLQRAVCLNPGIHQVKWVFSPPEVRWGLLLVGGGILLSIIFIVGGKIWIRDRKLARGKKWALVLLSNFLIVLLILAAAEFTYRKIAVATAEFEGEEYHRYDRKLGWIPLPGSYRGKRGNRVTITEEGFRETPPPDVLLEGDRILACGDSFTFCVEVSDDETWPCYLSRRLNTPVVNAGVSGYGLDQIVLRLESILDKIDPDSVVVSFIPEDIERCALETRDHHKPYFTVEDGKLRLRNVPVPPPIYQEEKEHWYDNILIFSHLRKWIRGETARGPLIRPAHENSPGVARLLFERLKNLAREKGFRLLLVIQPSAADSIEPDRGMADFAERSIRETGIPVLNLLEALEIDFGNNPEQRDELFRHHMTPAGNRWVARKVAAGLVD